ncbi:MAG TPA: phage baseplate protein [Thermoanaerobaculia bacterium]|nr:phage baseplate protein [Thermoanaerobaculia bacterium]
MNGSALTPSELLAIWERGEGQRPWRRALALLAGTAPHAPADELAAMPIGRRDATLVELRARLFGEAFTGITNCPACGEAIELSFDAAEVRRAQGSDGPLSMSAGGYDVDVRLPNTADLAAIERADDLDSARRLLFSRCITRARHAGKQVAPEELPPQVEETVIAALASVDPQADVTLDAACPACGHAWREPFDIVTFLWTELSVMAKRVIAEVHTLAAAYGWSERDILELSPARRNAYLEMLR